jgi:hypothetical protein
LKSLRIRRRRRFGSFRRRRHLCEDIEESVKPSDEHIFAALFYDASSFFSSSSSFSFWFGATENVVSVLPTHLLVIPAALVPPLKGLFCSKMSTRFLAPKMIHFGVSHYYTVVNGAVVVNKGCCPKIKTNSQGKKGSTPEKWKIPCWPKESC